MVRFGWGGAGRGADTAAGDAWAIDWFGDPWIRWFLEGLHQGAVDPELVAQLTPARRDYVLACLGHDHSPFPSSRASDLYSSRPTPATASVLAAVMVRDAWRTRGRRAASAVPRADAESFIRQLEAADAFLADAVAVWPDHAPLWVAALDTARGLNAPIGERAARYGRVQKIEQVSFAGAHRMLQSISKKWGGSHDLMMQFAHHCAGASEGSAILGMLPTAYIEIGIEGGIVFDDPSPEMTRSLRDGLSRLLTAMPSAPDPDHLEALERFVFVFRPVERVDAELVQQAMRVLGGHVPPYPTSMWRDPSRKRKKARRSREMQVARLL